MEAVERSPASARTLRAVRINPANLATGMVATLLIVYLGLNNGGYGVVERSEVGIAVWWTVLIGTVVGALPLAGGTRTGRALLILLAAFAGWTALSFGWTESDERTSLEVARVAATSASSPSRSQSRVASAGAPLQRIGHRRAVVCGLAVLSRLEPSMFPRRILGEYLPGIEIERRLAYPLNYSSGLGALPPWACPCCSRRRLARTFVGQGLAAAAVPVLVLTLWLTTRAFRPGAGSPSSPSWFSRTTGSQNSRRSPSPAPGRRS